MKLLTQYKGQLLITLLLFLVIWAMPFQDYMERTFTTDDMNYPEESIGIVSVSEGLMSVPDNAGSVMLNTGHIYLKKGTYEATFDVRSQAEGSTIDVCDSLSLNPDNTPGQVLASAPIPANGELVRLTFTVDEYVKGVQFRVHTKNAVQFASIYLLSQYGLYRDPCRPCASGLCSAPVLPHPQKNTAGSSDPSGSCRSLVLPASVFPLAFSGT